MCGIVGYIGKNNTAKNVINILKKLEYRGYDSAGICCFDKELKCYKAVGEIKKLNNLVDDNLTSKNMIAHTRWATHGKASKENCHPHISANHKWSIVHNGIIENYQEIKSKLIVKPNNETDTAVVCQMLEEKNAKTIFDFIKCFEIVNGSYGIVAQCIERKNTLFVAKRKSPIYIAQNNGDTLVASDTICFSGFSKKYITLSDNEFCEVDNGELFFYNQVGERIEKVENLLNESILDTDKQKYEHFMIKEINEQPNAIKNQIKTFTEQMVLEKFTNEILQKFEKVILVGCGTAYHACLLGSKYFIENCNMQSEAYVASEFIYSNVSHISKNTLFVFVTQSGETADTCLALEIAKNHAFTCIALTNSIYSTIANKADYIIPVCAGREIAVASTKAYLCQISALYMFSMHWKCQKENLNIDYKKEIEGISEYLLKFNFQLLDNLAIEISKASNVIFIGKHFDYVTANEASLKIKEVAYINASSYPSGELKHGFLALVDENTIIIAIAGNKSINIKTFNAVKEAVARGATPIIISNEEINEFENIVKINESNSMLFSMLSIVPLQYLAYKVSILKEINPDKPRNLAKSVTVE